MIPLLATWALIGWSSAGAAVPPDAPPGLSALASACNVASLSWGASQVGELPLYAYKVYRDGAFFRWVIAPSTATLDTGIGGAETHAYTVVAVDQAGNPSLPSNAATVTTSACSDMTPPSAPEGVVATTVDCRSIGLAWRAASDGAGFGLRGYRVYRDGGLLQLVFAPSTTLTDTAAAPATRHAFTVSAVDRAGNESATSGPAVATTPPCIPPAVNQPPVADAGLEQGGQTLVPLRFDASTSSDPDDGIVSYEWAFGDGTNASGRSVSHAYLRPGIYVVGLTVTDQGGLSATDVTRATVLNRAPVAVAGPNRTALVGQSVLLTDAGSSDADGTIVQYTWSFGDGTTATGAIASHVYAVAGTYTATLTVRDDTGAQGVDSLLVTIGDTVPPPDESGWARRLGGVGTDIGQGVAAAADGSVVVAGRLGGATTQALIARFSATGTQLWARTSSGAGTGEVYAVALDRAGDVFVTGWFQGTVDLGGGGLTSAGGTDLFVAKYRGSDGGHLWSERFGGTASDIGYALAADGDGVVVTGFFQGAADLGGGVFPAVLGGVDTFVARYASADGRHLWSRNVGGVSDDIGYGVAADGQGGVLVTGFFRGRVNFGSVLLQVVGGNDIFLAKLRVSDGQTVWAHGFGGTFSERGYGVAVDGRGDVALTGYFQGTFSLGGTVLTAGGSTDAFVAKFAGASGAPMWARGMGGPSEDYGFGVAVDGNGDVVVAGRFKDTVDFGGDPLTAAGASDAFVARYAGGSGAHMDSLRFGAEGNDLASAVSTNGTRTVVSGAFEDTVAFGGNSLSAADGADLFLLQVEQ